jgi:hypothetical protein
MSMLALNVSSVSSSTNERYEIYAALTNAYNTKLSLQDCQSNVQDLESYTNNQGQKIKIYKKHIRYYQAGCASGFLASVLYFIFKK